MRTRLGFFGASAAARPGTPASATSAAIITHKRRAFIGSPQRSIGAVPGGGAVGGMRVAEESIAVDEISGVAGVPPNEGGWFGEGGKWRGWAPPRRPAASRQPART